MDTPLYLSKASSKYSKKFNRLLKLIHEFEILAQKRKIHTQQTAKFIDDLLTQNRTTKEELSKYFIKYK